MWQFLESHLTFKVLLALHFTAMCSMRIAERMRKQSLPFTALLHIAPKKLRPPCSQQRGEGGAVHFDVTPLLGKRGCEAHSLLARQLAAAMLAAGFATCALYQLGRAPGSSFH